MSVFYGGALGEPPEDICFGRWAPEIDTFSENCFPVIFLSELSVVHAGGTQAGTLVLCLQILYTEKMVPQDEQRLEHLIDSKDQVLGLATEAHVCADETCATHDRNFIVAFLYKLTF
eukprot:gnl/MRDRNA2_/MRDRNA2_213278_c0_seq1.p1 gnl/MRDRNA2_/MRDRNA2_213278_c0~~gnl/MRDRNA2_/MRDRNA2_213278_c0_seq1.p1  ORF type:complete len:117 (-),score=11.15 gnl/MRDRNA2_/MRDRNA2_213278_c0_seq1:66-416(-)